MAGKTQTPAAACLTAEQPAALYAIPGGARSGSAWVDYRDAFLGSPAALQIEAIRRGAPAGNLLGAAEALHLPRERVYELVGLSVSTAKRKVAANEVLDPLVTERLVRLGGIEKLAEETFGDPALAAEWLQAVNVGLGGVAPLALLDTEIGCREVSRVLNVIAYGGAA